MLQRRVSSCELILKMLTSRYSNHFAIIPSCAAWKVCIKHLRNKIGITFWTLWLFGGDFFGGNFPLCVVNCSLSALCRLAQSVDGCQKMHPAIMFFCLAPHNFNPIRFHSAPRQFQILQQRSIDDLVVLSGCHLNHRGIISQEWPVNKCNNRNDDDPVARRDKRQVHLNYAKPAYQFFDMFPQRLNCLVQKLKLHHHRYKGEKTIVSFSVKMLSKIVKSLKNLHRVTIKKK